ncbi:MAG: integrase core domain-containing protein, partial [Cryomorphaceae bacterium]
HVLHSNSPVEAVNKIVKRYLRFYAPTNFEDVLKCLEWIKKDYNYKRPHGSLTGLTPMEAYRQPAKILDYTAEKSTAKAFRIIQNQKANCQTCQK